MISIYADVEQHQNINITSLEISPSSSWYRGGGRGGKQYFNICTILYNPQNVCKFNTSALGSICFKQFKISTLQYCVFYLVQYFGCGRVSIYDFESADARVMLASTNVGLDFQ